MEWRFQNAWSPLLVLVLAAGMGLAPAARASDPAATRLELSADDVVRNLIRNNLERGQALQAFEGTRTYKLQYQGFPGARSAEMVVDVKYRAPATKDFTVRSATGSRLLIDRVLNRLLDSEKEALTPENQRRVALNNDNYTFQLAGREHTSAGSYYIFLVEPRTKEKLLYRGRIWVDATDFAVARIEGSPAKNPSFWTKETNIEHVYTKIGEFWLPKSNHSTTSTRLGGHAYLTIDYDDYKVTPAAIKP